MLAFPKPRMSSDAQAFRETMEHATARGWCAVDLAPIEHQDAFEQRIASWAAPLGRVPYETRAARVLRPISSHDARRPSLSAVHGTGSFPLHIDGSHEQVPPRLIVLHCLRDSEDRPTLVRSWRSIVASLHATNRLEREVFVYRTGRRSFLDSIVARDRTFVRFDAGCMRPASGNAAELLTEIQSAASEDVADSIGWLPGRTLVVDNWRVLHGRGDAANPGSRCLLRTTLR